jgi:hypothetical protein
MDLDKMEQEIDELHKEAYGTDDAQGADDVNDSDDLGSEGDDEPEVKKEEDFKHKYEVLQGKYNAEMGRMNELLSATLSERAKVDTGKDDTFSDGSDDEEDLITQLKEEFPTIAKGVEAFMKKEIKAKLAPSESRINELAEATNTVVVNDYLEALDGAMSQWRGIREKPEFVQWLGQQDRYTGQTKLSLLQNADARRNVKAVAAFYEDFARESGLLNDEGANDNGADTPPPPKKNMAPSTSQNLAPSTGSKGTITRAEITQFYRDRALGKYSGSEEDAAKAEGRIMKAVREGKVR